MRVGRNKNRSVKATQTRATRKTITKTAPVLVAVTKKEYYQKQKFKQKKQM